MSGKQILLHPDDNILVVIAPIAAGERFSIDGREIISGQDIAVGHKVARRALEAGEKVLKYGAPIGSMIKPAGPGEWIHMHNLKSDYISSHTRDTIVVEGDGK